MIRHLIRLVWNRKRANILVLVEIFLSFMVLFAICSSGLYFYNNYSKPLGFSHEDVWVLQLRPPQNLMNPETREEGVNLFQQLLRQIRANGEVEHGAGAFVVAYGESHWMTSLGLNSRKLPVSYSPIGLDFEKVMELEMVEGRFWNETDLALTVKPLVINVTLARELFGSESAVGEVVEFNDTERKVIGVFQDYRHQGDLTPLKFFVMAPHILSKPTSYLYDKVVMKMAPGVSTGFEEKLMDELEAMAPGWSFTVQTMERMRNDHFKKQLSVMAIFGLVAVFMLVMVAMGLVGVLWQNVTRRTSELGVRRAKGATRNRIYFQILGELMVITTLAIFMGLVVAVQLPILGVTGSVGNGVLASGFCLALVLIYLLTTVSGLYPSWLATRVNPAEALHYE